MGRRLVRIHDLVPSMGLLMGLDKGNAGQVWRKGLGLPVALTARRYDTFILKRSRHDYMATPAQHHGPGEQHPHLYEADAFAPN